LNGRLFIQNRQRSHPVNAPRLRRLGRMLLREILRLERFDLGICLVGAVEMTRLNETFLRHKGSTDVITFDYADKAQSSLHGEIFICLDDVIANARRFGVSPQSELLRCVVHGVLHLRGFNDTRPAARRKMKGEENRLLRRLVNGALPKRRVPKGRSADL
jgi:probable rRNA maturation factor